MRSLKPSLNEILTFRYTCKFVCTFKLKSLNNKFYYLCYTQTIADHNIVIITGEIINPINLDPLPYLDQSRASVGLRPFP